MKIASIGVFCGSSAGMDEVYTHEAQKLGRLLASEGITMVYGGGNIGLMGVIADAMLAADGNVTGIIPRQLVGKELAHLGVTDMRVVEGMPERKRLIYDLSDAFIALPGGYGTMDEIFEMLTQFQLGLSDKPCGILNTHGFYDHLIAQLDHFVKERFLRREHRAHLLVAGDPAELLEMLRQSLFMESEDQQWIESLKTHNRY